MSKGLSMTRIIVVKNKKRNNLFSKKEIKLLIGLSQRVKLSDIHSEAQKTTLNKDIFSFMGFEFDSNYVAVANINGSPVLGKLITIIDTHKHAANLKKVTELLFTSFQGAIAIEWSHLVLAHDSMNPKGFGEYNVTTAFDSAVFVPLQEYKKEETEYFEDAVTGMFRCRILAQFSNQMLTDWQVDPESPHCAFRAIKSTGQRVAFIEKTPRIFLFKNDADGETREFWHFGPHGSGGADGHIPENELYGFDPDSRAWCDNMLSKMLYFV